MPDVEQKAIILDEHTMTLQGYNYLEESLK